MSSQSQKQQSTLQPPNQLPNYFSRHSVFFSTIDKADNKKVSAQLIRIKNNILILLLVLAAYGVYYLIGSFIDVIIIGYISGLAYVQARSRFARFVMSQKTYRGYNQVFWIRFVKAISVLLLGFVLPRLRYLLSNPHQLRYVYEISNIVKSFKKNTNLTVLLCQILCCLYSAYVLIAPFLKKIGQKIRPRNKTCIQITFGFIVLLATIASIALIPTAFIKQISQTGFIIQSKAQQALGCQFITFGDHNNKSMPLCSDRVIQNYMVKQVIEQFKNQNQTVQACKVYINEFQLDYIGHQVFDYNQIFCTWYSIVFKAYNSSVIQSQSPQLSPSSLFSTGTNIFKHVFGNLASFLSSISNIFFYFTIWLTTFLLTLRLPNRYFTIKHIFSQNKQQLVSDVTKLVHATCLIVIWHFICSTILLQLFDFTPINLIVATLLSLMAFVPFFRPWFGMLIVGAVRAFVARDYVVTGCFVGIYWYVSEWIYSFYYGKLKIHEVIINSSVLFGIYSFGVTGIFYGPLIVILFSCLQKQLLQNQSNEPNGNQIKLKQKQSSYIDDQKQLQQDTKPTTINASSKSDKSHNKQDMTNSKSKSNKNHKKKEK